MGMRKNDEDRCNCGKIFPKEKLDCCCDEETRDCVCEETDYKCCMEMTPEKCCESGSDTSNKDCECRRQKEEDVRSFSIKRDSDDQDKCCCEENGKSSCCCRKVQETSCFCEHEEPTQKGDSDESKSKAIENTNVDRSSATAESETMKCILESSDLVEEIPSDLDDPSILTSTCLASTKDKTGGFREVDETLLSELKEFKNSSLSQESYDVYIVNDEGRVNSFELKHFVNSKSQVDESNPKEILLNKQVHGICIKNKQSEMSSTYQGKVKNILDKIKEQTNTFKPNEPTILEITEFSLTNKDKTTEIIKNVFGKDVSTCRCNGKTSCLCECNVSKVEIIQGSEESQTPLQFTDLKSLSAEADALNSEVDKIKSNTTQNTVQEANKTQSNKTQNTVQEANKTQSNKTQNTVQEANESAYYDHQVESGEDNRSLDKLYYSINTSSETDFDTTDEDIAQAKSKDSSSTGEDTSSDPKEEIVYSSRPLDSPFEDDMKNKIEDLMDAQAIQQDVPIETININIGGHAIADQGLDVTTFKMSIHGDDLDERIGLNESRSEDVVNKMIDNLSSNPKEEESSIHKSTRIELERLKEFQESTDEVSKPGPSMIEEKIGHFGVKLGNVIKTIFEGNSSQQSTPSKSSSVQGSEDSISRPESSRSTPSKSSSVQGSEDSIATSSQQSTPSKSSSVQVASSQRIETSRSESSQSKPVSLFNKTFVSYESLQKSSSSNNLEESCEDMASKSVSRTSSSAVSCLAKTRKTGNTIEIALHLTNNQQDEENQTVEDSSTITFIEQDSEENSSCLLQVKRNNKVGKLIEYFEDLERKRSSQ